MKRFTNRSAIMEHDWTKIIPINRNKAKVLIGLYSLIELLNWFEGVTHPDDSSLNLKLPTQPE